MTRWIGAAIVALVLGPQAHVFRSGAEGIRVDVLVTNGKAPVAGLTAKDFIVTDNGVRQAIASVQFGDVPLSVILALDASGSVEGFPLAQLKAAATRALATLTSRDAAALLEFNQELSWASHTNAPSVLGAQASAISAEGGTSLHDAVLTALLRSDPRLGRPLVLLFTDGVDTASWLPPESVYAAATRTDAVVYAVTLKPAGTPFPYMVDYAARLPLGAPAAPRGAKFLEHLAAETGGRGFLADRTADIESRLVDALKEFKSRYVVTYTPAGVDTTGWHELDVQVKKSGVKVTARRGYQR